MQDKIRIILKYPNKADVIRQSLKSKNNRVQVVSLPLIMNRLRFDCYSSLCPSMFFLSMSPGGREIKSRPRLLTAAGLDTGRAESLGDPKTAQKIIINRLPGIRNKPRISAYLTQPVKMPP